MVLHALAIMLFGAPSGGSREGRAMWGALQVVIRGAPVDAAPKLKVDRERALPAPSRAAPAKKPETVDKAPTALGEDRPRIEAPDVFPPLLDRIVAPDLKLESAPEFRVPPPTEMQKQPPPSPGRGAARESPPAAPVERIPAEPPVISAPLLQPLPTPADRPLAVPVEPPIERVTAEPPVLAAPLLQPLPPVPQPEMVKPVEPAPPPVERVPVETPVPPRTPPIERAPVEVQALPVPPARSVAPSKAEPPPATAEKAPVPEVAPRPRDTAIERAPAVRPTPSESPAKLERDLPAKQSPAPTLRSPPVGSPAPPADSLFKRRDEPSSTYDPTAAPPRLDPEELRRRAGEMAREGTGRRAVLPFPMPPIPERKTKEQIAIEKARKPDCRTAYQGLGLAAIVPLIANEFGEGSCRW